MPPAMFTSGADVPEDEDPNDPDTSSSSSGSTSSGSGPTRTNTDTSTPTDNDPNDPDTGGSSWNTQTMTQTTTTSGSKNESDSGNIQQYQDGKTVSSVGTDVSGSDTKNKSDSGDMKQHPDTKNKSDSGNIKQYQGGTYGGGTWNDGSTAETPGHLFGYSSGPRDTDANDPETDKTQSGRKGPMDDASGVQSQREQDQSTTLDLGNRGTPGQDYDHQNSGAAVVDTGPAVDNAGGPDAVLATNAKQVHAINDAVSEATNAIEEDSSGSGGSGSGGSGGNDSPATPDSTTKWIKFLRRGGNDGTDPHAGTYNIELHPGGGDPREGGNRARKGGGGGGQTGITGVTVFAAVAALALAAFAALKGGN